MQAFFDIVLLRSALVESSLSAVSMCHRFRGDLSPHDFAASAREKVCASAQRPNLERHARDCSSSTCM
eukprot:3307861-Rhodomonas_salina.2